jgi:carbamoyl-phosphate synthase small subunit
MMNQTSPAWLLLADGSVMEGRSFGCKGTTIGEVVFATGMTGYQETLTDPSYYGQIVTQTFPLIGNYGVNGEDYESAGSVVRGYIVREYCEEPSNFRSAGGIDDFLKQQGIIALCGIDTRALTRRIREHGVMNGAITTEPIDDKRKEALLAELRAYAVTEAVASVSVKEPQEFPVENERFHVALLDFGYKYNIRRSLLRRGCR